MSRNMQLNSKINTKTPKYKIWIKVKASLAIIALVFIWEIISRYYNSHFLLVQNKGRHFPEADPEIQSSSRSWLWRQSFLPLFP